MDDLGAGMVIAAMVFSAAFAGGFKCGQSNARSEFGTPVGGPAVSPDPVTKQIERWIVTTAILIFCMREDLR